MTITRHALLDEGKYENVLPWNGKVGYQSRELRYLPACREVSEVSASLKSVGERANERTDELIMIRGQPPKSVQRYFRIIYRYGKAFLQKEAILLLYTHKIFIFLQGHHFFFFFALFPHFYAAFFRMTLYHHIISYHIIS